MSKTSFSDEKMRGRENGERGNRFVTLILPIIRMHEYGVNERFKAAKFGFKTYSYL